MPLNLFIKLRKLGYSCKGANVVGKDENRYAFLKISKTVKQ